MDRGTNRAQWEGEGGRGCEGRGGVEGGGQCYATCLVRTSILLRSDSPPPSLGPLGSRVRGRPLVLRGVAANLAWVGGALRTASREGRVACLARLARGACQSRFVETASGKRTTTPLQLSPARDSVPPAKPSSSSASRHGGAHSRTVLAGCGSEWRGSAARAGIRRRGLVFEKTRMALRANLPLACEQTFHSRARANLPLACARRLACGGRAVRPHANLRYNAHACGLDRVSRTSTRAPDS